jgi:hypothetical protein
MFKISPQRQFFSDTTSTPWSTNIHHSGSIFLAIWTGLSVEMFKNCYHCPRLYTGNKVIAQCVVQNDSFLVLLSIPRLFEFKINPASWLLIKYVLHADVKCFLISLWFHCFLETDCIWSYNWWHAWFNRTWETFDRQDNWYNLQLLHWHSYRWRSSTSNYQGICHSLDE